MVVYAEALASAILFSGLLFSKTTTCPANADTTGDRN